MFFSIDGLDGAGKTTQLERFCQWLRESGHEVVRCYDPGSTALGEVLREILLGGKSGAIGRRSEMLLFMAARAQMVDEVISPALAAGKVVVADRYLLANVVYQGYAGGLDVDTLWQIGRVATAGVLPEVTFVLDMPADDAARRIDRPLDRMESQGDDFRSRLQQGYRLAAARDTQHIKLIAADRDIATIAEEIRVLAEPLLTRQNPKSSATGT